MNDDPLVERLHRMAEDLPVQVTDVVPVRRRARLRRVRSRAIAGLTVTLVGLGVILPLRSLSGLGGEVAEPKATSWTETYILSDFDVEYPMLVSGGDPGRSQPDPTMAAVTFRAAWSGDVYPGEAQCEVRLFDGDGREVGEESFGFATYEPMAEEPSGVAMGVDRGEPVSAEGSCDLGAPPQTAIAVGDDFGGFQGLVLSERALGTDDIARTDFEGEVEIKFFWASWSGGAGEYLGSLERMDQRYGTRIAVLGIDVRDDDAAALELMHSAGVSFWNLADPSGEIADRFGLTEIPLAFVVDGETNEVLAIFPGSDSAPLESYIEATLGSIEEPMYYVDGARPAVASNGHVQCVPWSAAASYLRICQDPLPDGFIPGGPPGGIDDYPEVCALALEQPDFDPKGGLPIPADLEDIGPADEEVVEPQSCFVTPLSSYPAQDPSRPEFAVSFSLRGTDENTHFRVQAPAGSAPASSTGSVDEACPSGQLIQVNRWEDTVERLRDWPALPHAPDAAAGWPHVDQFVVVPDDPGRFVGEVPEGSVLALNCVPIADGSALVRAEGDNGSFIPDSNVLAEPERAE